MKNVYSLALRITIIFLTIAFFTYYLNYHPVLLQQLLRIPLNKIAWLVLLYVAWFSALVLTVYVTLLICRTPLLLGENILLNAYSTLVNFFVPGQGGLAVRAIYLKKRHDLGIRSYVLATLVYYMCYAIVSTLMLLVASRPWWQTLAGLVFVFITSIFVVRWYRRRSGTKAGMLDLSALNLLFLLGSTILQAGVQVAVYAFELRAVNPGISLSQAITYTGAANFSLFVALTPGAIGIRESFLVFSEKLHQVSTATIVAASVMDRAVFLILLAFLFVLTIVFHAKKSLKLK